MGNRGIEYALLLRNFVWASQHITIEVDLDNEADSPLQTLGIYSHLGRDCVGLFAIENSLFLYLNGQATTVSSDVTVEWRSQQERWRELTLSLISVDYVISYEAEKPVSTIFWSEDDSDVDFGLRLRDILSSEERKQDLVENWKGGLNSGRTQKADTKDN